MAPGADSFSSGYITSLHFANSPLIRGLWGLELRFETLRKPPQPLRPSRRAQTAAQGDFGYKTAACSDPQLSAVAARSGPKPPNQIP